MPKKRSIPTDLPSATQSPPTQVARSEISKGRGRKRSSNTARKSGSPKAKERSSTGLDLAAAIATESFRSQESISGQVHPAQPTATGESEISSQAQLLLSPSVSVREKIALLAYSYWEERGRQGGSPEDDWLRAEREITGGLGTSG